MDLFDCFIANLKNNCINCKEADFEESIQSKPTNNFSIVPSPNDGVFSIEFSSDSGFLLNIYDILGNKIYQNSDTNGRMREINLRSYSSGIYIAEVKFGSEIIRQKFIISH